ncbi:hypothetical protein [Roseovarius sp. M141]|uniref:hypothetical protein n=1 Tax=Roseovarius sp. M141 TaxID=2583806 RepID=UPI0034E95CC3
MIPLLGGSGWLPCIDHHQQDAGVLAFPFRLAMLNEHIAGELDQVIGMMDHVGQDGPGLCKSVCGPI